MNFMRPLYLVLALGVANASVSAQAARVGRLPVLELPAAGGRCRVDPTSAELRHDGIVRSMTFTSSDSSAHRQISVGLSTNGDPVILTAMMGTTQGRRNETESVQAMFDHTGHVWRGQRSAFTTGTPASRADDTQLALLAADTLAVERLARALIQRCRN